ncbi:MAG TPA: ABC transporter substrate-binding protein [Spirillospora sp.]|nr:ABC transporter substrate-binding protein [Spirillospora sp.]
MLAHTSAARPRAAVLGLALIAAGLSACSSGDSGPVKISMLTLTDSGRSKASQDLVAAFEKANPDIKIKINSIAGADTDNTVKTKLATGSMEDVFMYNTGSLFNALNPDSRLNDLADQSWTANLTPDFKPVVSTGKGLYGAPFGTVKAGAVFYNKKVYQRLGLSVPTSWPQFIANSQKIKNAGGIAPIIQTYGDVWTSQLFVLGDFANVLAQDPQWAAKYTANKVDYSTPPAIAGFQHLEQAHQAGLFNKDFASITNAQGLKMLAEGKGAQYPMLTTTIATVAQNDPGAVNDIGVFPLPADDPAYTRLTVWEPVALYSPKSTTGKKLDAARKFIAFATAGQQGCDIQNKDMVPSGPYATSACKVPETAPALVKDMTPYFDKKQTATALEFQSPVKGPNLPNIAVQVGSGISTAAKGASLYDQDVKKQAQQLGLPGW